MTIQKGLILSAVTVLVLLAQPASRASDYPPRQWFTPEQIDRMVAPIALYSDALLAQVLMAASYPDDVQEAARWLRRHPHLRGADLDLAAARQPWDASVQALLYFPQILQRMTDYPDWTEDLGIAFLQQEDDLMDAVQRLRQEAWAAGSLRSTEQQYVYREGDIIVIQPVDARVVYVPTYDSRTVYTQGYSSTDDILSFGAGAVVGGLLTAAILWDSGRDHHGPHHHIYHGDHGRWRDPGYWNHHDYRKGDWRRPDRITYWQHDEGRHDGDPSDSDRGHSGSRPLPPMQPWQPRVDRFERLDRFDRERGVSRRHDEIRQRSDGDANTPVPWSSPRQPPADQGDNAPARRSNAQRMDELQRRISQSRDDPQSSDAPRETIRDLPHAPADLDRFPRTRYQRPEAIMSPQEHVLPMPSLPTSPVYSEPPRLRGGERREAREMPPSDMPLLQRGAGDRSSIDARMRQSRD